MEENDIKTINIKTMDFNINKKKLVQNHKMQKEIKKRVVSEKWTFSEDYFEHNNQLLLIENIINKLEENISEDNTLNTFDGVEKIVIQQINRKIYGYKQQDFLKKIYDDSQFITFNNIIKKMNECKLKCYYCKNNMDVLYDISREMTQWSVDRIDNFKGHNNNNFYLSCLDCNLKRRRKDDEKFRFTKQLNIVKCLNIDSNNI